MFAKKEKGSLDTFFCVPSHSHFKFSPFLARLIPRCSEVHSHSAVLDNNITARSFAIACCLPTTAHYNIDTAYRMSSFSLVKLLSAAVGPSSSAFNEAPLASTSAAARPSHSPPIAAAAAPSPPQSAVMMAPSLSNDAKEEQSTPPPEEPTTNKAASHAVDASSSEDDAAADTGTADTAAITADGTPAPQSFHGDNTTTDLQPPSSTSVQQRSRRRTANYQQDYSSEGIIPAEEEGGVAALPSANEDDNHDDTLSSFNLTSEERIIISLKDPNYKSFMHSYFQKLGDNINMPKEDREDEKQVKDEMVALLKKAGGGTFWNYVNFRYPEMGVVEVEEKVARTSELVVSCVEDIDLVSCLFDVYYITLFHVHSNVFV